MDGSSPPTDIYETIVEFIDAGLSFVLAVILKSDGSTPRKAGVKAVIDETGKIWGTLGGGLVEAESQRRAIEICGSQGPMVFEVNLEGADSCDDTPICGGSVRILIDPTAAKNRASYAQAAQAVRQRQRGVLLMGVRSAAQTEVTLDWYAEGDVPPEIGFPDSDAVRCCLGREESELFVQDGVEANVVMQVLVEPVIPKPLLLIVGGGHIGQALAHQGILVGFDIVVLDDRPEFTESGLFPPGTVSHCGDVAEELTRRAIENDTYIVIVTRGHKHDAEALEACMASPAAYIGMIGSKRKVALIRRDFIASGVATEEQFDGVFAPIGLDIGSVTVPEIAASITGQLIAVRRKGAAYARRDDGAAR